VEAALAVAATNAAKVQAEAAKVAVEKDFRPLPNPLHRRGC